MITHDLIGTDEDLAREVLVVARDIAPCLSTLPAWCEAGKNAVAILRNIYKEIQARGPRGVRSQSVGGASVSYGVEDAFDGRSKRALKALCGSASTRGHSQGSFPQERPLTRLWPELY